MGYHKCIILYHSRALLKYERVFDYIGVELMFYGNVKQDVYLHIIISIFVKSNKSGTKKTI